ncbi:accessory Sec system translocase SecA2 [Amycolatopsis acidiphila]|uniref:Protein translocase subunit SecA n=1 Tax=Amycolatopsis acidiphila TaxID=715473 RepID=A0A557ZPR4_9PSEU|nr:accessory Sec system translocase SecA2 [Amycolatopsis acidiphila]TVT14016.1 accessory Sec system translocase SecA2 [Amycolatopsis acidiphila]UIJ61058.1 accessory Sec system translocase SecA2 [Amycolatopsis acidiphila]GHG99259.1 protein translocase subunit SecA [Amycolatopsis acidiphila]
MPALITRMGKRLRRLMERPGSAELSRYEALLPAIGELEAELEELTDTELTERAGKLRLEAEFADPQLVELCALGREAARRALDERAFDVQLLGTMGLLTGHVVQMETGEGKTLAGALAAAGYALQGKRVHVTTVNDYLARRDAEWMKPVYDLLGVSVGWIEPSLTRGERREAYAREITYGAVSEIGFDVLRDRLVTRVEDLVQPDPEVAIVDEADSVLVDEARVPLVMAGSVDHAVADVEVANVVRRLRLGLHYETDSDGRNAWLTTAGASVVEKALGGIDLYGESGSDRLAAVNVALHAHALLTRDVDYLVRDGKVQLINASRGRVAELQRWPDGLQAAVEAKEQLPATDRGEILDSITVQALLARYPQVAGMTGTAVAVAEQLREFYKLEVAVIPPNKPNVREDHPDRIFASPSQKLRAIEAEIREVHETGRPILVGTQDVAESEELAEKLAKIDLPCVVLNARNDAEEAGIIAEAGTYGAVTVSTQMAGRGTDIRLGGADGKDRERVAELGGLHVIGTARYPSSRLDGQLRGRSGRQGDPGSAVFFASLNDELVLSNAPDVPEGIAADDETGEITDPAAQRQINHAQRVAEGVHLEIHRNTWRYTRLIEHQRRELLAHRDKLLRTALAAETLKEAAPKQYEELAEALDDEALEQTCREIVLFHLDELWSDHLAYLTDVRESIHLRAIARETPLDEFHRLAIPEFHKIIPAIEERSVKTLEEAEIGENGVDLSASGVRRPSSTWTYLVHDNPFDSDFEQTLKQVRSLIKRGKD